MERTPVPEEFKAAADHASLAQLGYIRSLLDNRDLSTLSDEQLRWLENVDFNKLSKKGASRVIDALKPLDMKPKSGPSLDGTFPNVPAGRYAVENEKGVLRFYVVQRPDKGKWAGYTFLSVQASSELHPIKDRNAKFGILRKIAADPKVAMQRYGFEIGRCGICGRTLTNEESRRLGIGPVCAGKQGWL